jgi:mRNA interferase MazF
MKHKIVLVPFPFDDLSSSKVRPAVCLTDEIKPYGHIVVAFITSNISNPAATDLVIPSSDPEFKTTGLKVASTVRLHRLMTVSKTIFLRHLGELSPAHIIAVEKNLRDVFKL